MSEEGTAVLDEKVSQEEERSPGGLLTKQEFEDLKEGVKKAAASRDKVSRENEPVVTADAPPAEPDDITTKAADEPSREPEPVASEPVASESTEPEVSEPAEPAEKKVDEESPAAGFDDQLLARAEQMGFSKQAAQSFGTPDKLETALTVLDQRLIGLAKPTSPAPQVPAPQVPVQQVSTTGPAAPPAQSVQAPPVQPVADALTIDLDPEEHDPAIVDQFKKVNAHWEARASQLEQILVGMFTAMQSGQRQSEAQFISQSIDALDDKIKSLITPEIQVLIGPNAKSLKSSLSQNGFHVPSDFDLIKRAAQGLLSEQLVKNEHERATDEISAKLEKRASQRTARPIQHHSAEPELTRKEKKEQSVKKIRAHMSERGMI